VDKYVTWFEGWFKFDSGAYTAGLTEYLNSIGAHNPGTTMSNPSKTAEPITPKDGQNGTHDTNAKTEETS